MFEISKSKDIESPKIKEAKNIEKKREKKKKGWKKQRKAKNSFTGSVKGGKENIPTKRKIIIMKK